MTAYYNEHDRFKAQWLRELIKMGAIAQGEVDERDIRDIKPRELRGYTQCHFFAGVGVWSYAARLAGWPDDKPMWTGSCPCQPFSVAGKRKEAADKRHLWPAWQWLIGKSRPDVIFGEQVANGAGAAWFDTVSTDLEGSGYACGAVHLPACGVGAPHLRQRLFFVAESDRERLDLEHALLQPGRQDEAGVEASRRCEARDVGDTSGTGSRRDTGSLPSEERENQGAREISRCRADQLEFAGALGHAHGFGQSSKRRIPKRAEIVSSGGPVNGFWSDAEWIYCRDEKYRAVEPGVEPLAYGAPARMGRLRGYGDAIVAQAAAAFIKAYTG